jgi:hypothetical protein
MSLKKRTLVTLGTGSVLVVVSLLVIAQFNSEMRGMSNAFVSLLRGINGVVGLVSAAGKLSHALAPPPEFQWNWRDVQELKASQSLRNAKLLSSEKQALAEAISARLQPDMSAFEIESEEQLRAAAMDTRVRVINLNLAAGAEIVAQARVGCSPTGNCPFWIFQKAGTQYRPLLVAEAQTFTIQRSATNGFRDIVLGRHGSATESSLTEYKFREDSYKEAGCYEASYIPVGYDKVHGVEEPVVSPCN